MNVEQETNKITSAKLTAEELANTVFQTVEESINPKYLKIIVDVKKSKVHRPVQVWIERSFSTKESFI